VRRFENDRVLTGRNLSLERLDERDVVEQVERKSRQLLAHSPRYSKTYVA